MAADGSLVRRDFLRVSGAMAAGLALAGCRGADAPSEAKPSAPDIGVTPPEDLMREHGVLRRILMIYEEVVRRLDSGEFKAAELKEAAGLVQKFVEDYHEKLEEEHLFPRFEKAGRLADLTKTLRAQHEAGRRLTADLLRVAGVPGPISAADQVALRSTVGAFCRMYRPHAAREDTVLFPAFRDVVTPKEFDSLGDAFEDKENELFGKDGFETIVTQVAAIEKKLGIEELAQFTPAK